MTDTISVTSPSNEVHPPNQGWNVDTLREYLLALRQADQQLLQERFTSSQTALNAAFSAQKNAVDTALVSAEKAVNAALATAKEAVIKAENASEKRFDNVNEWRQTLNDRDKNTLPRQEADVRFGALTEKFDALEKQIDIANGAKTGGHDMLAVIISLSGFAIGLMALLINFLR